MTRAELEAAIGKANRAGKSRGTDGLPSTLEVVYAKKTTGRVVSRRVRPYEVRGGTLWATDTIHGASRIHNFLTRRVLSIRPSRPGRTFRPQWKVQTPGVKREARGGRRGGTRR